MKRLLAGLGILLALAVPSQAVGYYVPMSTWSTWAAQGVSVSTSSVAQAPDTIYGNYLGVLSLGGPGASGDFGNIYAPLSSNTWAAGDTFVYSYDVKVLSGTDGLRTQTYTRPGYGPDGSTESSNAGGIYDGQWHHVTVTIPMPVGYNWTDPLYNPYPPATNSGNHDFLSLGSISVDIFRNGGPYGDTYSLQALVDNVSIFDQTTSTEYALNGSFSQFTGTRGTLAAIPTGYGISGRSGLYVLYIPEPATLALFALGGLALLRRRK